MKYYGKKKMKACLLTFALCSLFAVFFLSFACYAEGDEWEDEEGITVIDRTSLLSYKEIIIDNPDVFGLAVDGTGLSFAARAEDLTETELYFEPVEADSFDRLTLELSVNGLGLRDEIVFMIGDGDNFECFSVSSGAAELKNRKLCFTPGDDVDFEYIDRIYISFSSPAGSVYVYGIYAENDRVLAPLDEEYYGTRDGMFYEYDVYPLASGPSSDECYYVADDGSYRYVTGAALCGDVWRDFDEDGMSCGFLEGEYYIEELSLYVYFEGGIPVTDRVCVTSDGYYVYTDALYGPYVSVTEFADDMLVEFDSEGLGTAYTGIYDGVNYVDGFPSEPTVLGYSISLNGMIELNFYVGMGREETGDGEWLASFEAEDSYSEVYGYECDPADFDYPEGAVFVYTVSLPASKIAKQVYFTLYYNGESVCTDTYSVLEYAGIIIENSEDDPEYERAKPLVIAMLNYGGCAQRYFGENKGLANQDVLSEVAELFTVSDEEILALSGTFSESGEIFGIEFTGNALKLDSSMAVRHYFRLTEEADAGGFYFETEDSELYPAEDGDEYYIEITDITAQMITSGYTVTVNGGEYSFFYSPINYVQYVLYYGGTEKATALARAIYFYAVAANEYFS